MKSEELYAEVPCPRCGNKRLKWSSFCPHCGHVQEQTFLERLKSRLDLGGQAGHGALVLIVVMVGLGIAAALAAAAISSGRYQDLITILIIAVLAIRAFLRLRKGSGPATEPDRPDQADQDVSAEDEDPSSAHYSCEKCGTPVRSDAEVCPKCGMRFAP